MGEMLGNGFVRWKGEDVSKTLGVGTPTGLMTGVVFDLANPVSPCILISGDNVR